MDYLESDEEYFDDEQEEQYFSDTEDDIDYSNFPENAKNDRYDESVEMQMQMNKIEKLFNEVGKCQFKGFSVYIEPFVKSSESVRKYFEIDATCGSVPKLDKIKYFSSYVSFLQTEEVGFTRWNFYLKN